MNKSIITLKNRALDSLRNNWGLAIGVFIVFQIVIGASSLFFIGPILISGPLLLGAAIFTLNLSRKYPIEFSQLFDGFNRFGTALGAHLLSLIYIFLWSLLLIIPGIIAALSYSMTFFIIADNPTISADEAITTSKEMMNGHKMDLLILYLSFIGWFILCFFTFFIGLLWLIPYMQVTIANFYDEVRKEYYNEEDDPLSGLGKTVEY
ncbi:MAG: DUF975 family protein [Saprospiraceae bacterium]|nr:DUF975 family protein [Saprospiraceae bacterium]